jgi:hypothetical protein
MYQYFHVSPNFTDGLAAKFKLVLVAQSHDPDSGRLWRTVTLR